VELHTVGTHPPGLLGRGGLKKMWTSVTVILCFFIFSFGYGRKVPEHEENKLERIKRDLILENMVMRTHNSSTRKESAKPLVGGGILERKIIIASNGTERRHHESREMECCHHVVVEGDDNGGIFECHPYVFGGYKKIGVCGGRSIYQHNNNTEIFMYYGCGRWFIGLEIGVCGGWVFTKTMDICVHGRHEKDWQFVSEVGLNKDKSLKVKEACQDPAPVGRPRPIGAESNFRPFHDYVDRTEYGQQANKNYKKEEEKKYSQHTLDLSALYRQPLLNYNINEVNEDSLQDTPENNNYLLELIYNK